MTRELEPEKRRVGRLGGQGAMVMHATEIFLNAYIGADTALIQRMVFGTGYEVIHVYILVGSLTVVAAYVILPGCHPSERVVLLPYDIDDAYNAAL